MGNQYSITVNDRAARILNGLKECGYMPSRVISAVICTLGQEGCARIQAMAARIAWVNKQEMEEME